MQVNTIELKGKPLSLGSKILGCSIAVGALVMKATIAPALDIDAALKVAAFVVIVFAPVDLSMIFGNILGARTHQPSGAVSFPGGGGK